MSHDLETSNGRISMAYVGEVPWHGLGTPIEPGIGTLEMLKVAGLDWKVEKRPVYMKATSGEFVVCPDNGSIVRLTDEKVLGVVGKGYEPVQNEFAFLSIDPIVQQKHGQWETAGSLKGGKTIWGMLKMTEPFEVVPGDEVRSYLLVTNNHDSTRVFQTRFTPVRVVCANTLAMAVGNQKNRGEEDKEFDARDGTIRIRHTKNVEAAVAEAGRLMHVAYKAAKLTQEMFQAMTKVSVTESAMKKMIEALVPPTAAKDQSGTEAIRHEIFRLTEEGRGTEIPGVKGTPWAFYNGATEYVDHVRAVVVDKPGKPPMKAEDRQQAMDSRLGQIWFGTGFKLKMDALKIAEKATLVPA
jgi:phage/plasmid-like protein (TIGR03299 family)